MASSSSPPLVLARRRWPELLDLVGGRECVLERESGQDRERPCGRRRNNMGEREAASEGREAARDDARAHGLKEWRSRLMY